MNKYNRHGTRHHRYLKESHKDSKTLVKVISFSAQGRQPLKLARQAKAKPLKNYADQGIRRVVLALQWQLNECRLWIMGMMIRFFLNMFSTILSQNIFNVYPRRRSIFVFSNADKFSSTYRINLMLGSVNNFINEYECRKRKDERLSKTTSLHFLWFNVINCSRNCLAAEFEPLWMSSKAITQSVGQLANQFSFN